MFRLMLDHHPAIAMNGEFEYAVDQVSDRGEWPELSDYHEWLATNLMFELSDFEVDRALSYPELIQSFLEQRRERAGKELVGAKLCRHFDRLLYLWPRARLIHLIRDGRDVARSVVNMGWAGNVWTGVQWWLDAERTWDRLKVLLDEDQWTELRYEDLVSRPKETLQGVCDFIRVGFDRQMLEYPRETSYEQPDPALAYHWRRELSERDIQLIEARAGDLLIQRGYSLSGLPRVRLSRCAERRLQLDSRLKRFAFAARRHGALFYTFTIVARRIGPKRLVKRFTLRMNETTKRHLR